MDISTDSHQVRRLEVVDTGRRSPSSAAPGKGVGSRVIIVLGNGRRIIVDSGVDTAVLARILDVLERG